MDGDIFQEVKFILDSLQFDRCIMTTPVTPLSIAIMQVPEPPLYTKIQTF